MVIIANLKKLVEYKESFIGMMEKGRKEKYRKEKYRRK
jgi:hypothetical protein